MNEQLYNHQARLEGKPILQWCDNIVFSVKTDNPAYLKIHKVWAKSSWNAESIGERLLLELVEKKVLSNDWQTESTKATSVNEYEIDDEGRNEYEVVFTPKKTMRRRIK